MNALMAALSPSNPSAPISIAPDFLDRLDSEILNLRGQVQALYKVRSQNPNPSTSDASGSNSALLKTIDQTFGNLSDGMGALQKAVTGLPSKDDIEALLFPQQSIETSVQVYFDRGRASLRPKAAAPLESLAAFKGSAWTFRVIGFADPSGRPEANLRLGNDRASFVAAWLVSHLEIDLGRIATSSGGETTQFSSVAGNNGNRCAVVYVIRKSAAKR
jgi:outer membrane protein OmpA-like peptidoglycan-associated protein